MMYRPFVPLFLLTLTTPALCRAGQQTPPSANTPPVAAPKPAPVIEAKALAVLKRNQQAMLTLRTYQAECRTIQTNFKPTANKPAREYELATLQAAKPNLLRYDHYDLSGDPTQTGWQKPARSADYLFACDGNLFQQQFGNIYQTSKDTSPQAMTTLLEPWRGFYSPSNSILGAMHSSQRHGDLRAARYLGREKVDGVVCDTVAIDTVGDYGGTGMELHDTWDFGPDGLVRRSRNRVQFDDAEKSGFTREATLTHLRLNAPIAKTVYAYAPPKGVRALADLPRPQLLTAGTPAPDFEAQDKDSKAVKLSDYRGKVVVLDFWASWCGPCMASMPHNQEIAAKLQAEGLPVVLFAVDDGEARDAFAASVKTQQVKYPALTYAHVAAPNSVSGGLYKVTGIPTQYVIDKNGVVRASFVGYGGPTDALEKAVRAALATPADRYEGDLLPVTQKARKQQLRDALHSVREMTLVLMRETPDDLLTRRVHDFYSPVGWHFGHIGMTEEFWTCHKACGLPPLDDRLMFLFANLPENPKENRTQLPSRQEILAYLALTRQRTLDALDAADIAPDHPNALLRDGYAWNFALEHECQHQETIMELSHLLTRATAPPNALPKKSGLPNYTPSPVEMRALPGGTFTMGTDRHNVYDNERGAHPVTVGPFQLDITPAQCGQWIAFIVDGGYQRPELWSEAGWQWRLHEQAEMPEYWFRSGKRYGSYGPGELRLLEKHEPVYGISAWEADAFARWQGKRLPTEAEWEYALCVDGEDESASELHGMNGCVWQWTSSAFLPYPGFAAFPYDGYSLDHMDGQHRVCRGGSWATNWRLQRITFRNWYVPGYRQGFLGVRCARD